MNADIIPGQIVAQPTVPRFLPALRVGRALREGGGDAAVFGLESAQPLARVAV